MEHPDENTLKMIEEVLDFIRSNLNNVRNTWGSSSPQYQSATEIMKKCFADNMEKLHVDTTGANLEALLSDLSLEGKAKSA